jgi:hypothetical protein
MKRILLVTAFAAVGAFNLAAQVAVEPQPDCGGFPGSRPSIEAVFPHVDVFGHLLDSSRYRDFRGLLIEENYQQEVYPIVTTVFFAQGTTKIPARYNPIFDRPETAGFTDTIAGGTLHKNHHILNVIGYRLTKNPNATIEITGKSSNEKALGEDCALALARARIVSNYLVSIWQIDPSRIKLLTSCKSPIERDPVALAENRSAEIRSDEWEIMKPIITSGLGRYPQPRSVGLVVDNGIPDSLLARRVIEIRRHGELWYSTEEMPGIQGVPLKYNWGKNGIEDSIPTDEAPFEISFTVYAKNGTACKSPTNSIPVLIFDSERKAREGLVPRKIQRFTANLFRRGSADIDAYNARIIRDYIYPSVHSGAIIKTEGFASGEPGQDLAYRRGDEMAQLIARHFNDPTIQFYVSDDPHFEALYPQGYPEERILNRTVQITVESQTP